MTSPPRLPTVHSESNNKTKPTTTVTTTNNNNNRSVDTADVSSASTSSSERRGVRFAKNLEREEDMPWDQKKDMKKHRSPTSIWEERDEAVDAKPKSILRASRFPPNSSRYYGTERRALDFESLQLQDRSALDGGGFDREVRATVDYDWAKNAAVQTNISRHLDRGEELDDRMSQSRESSSVGQEVPPPSSGFINRTGSDISSIRSSRTTEKGVLRSSPIAGHPAEKHLQESIASVRSMHGGDIAARVIEEDNYPDPPIDIDVSVVSFGVCTCVYHDFACQSDLYSFF